MRMRFRSRAARCNGKTSGPNTSRKSMMERAGWYDGSDCSEGRATVALDIALLLLWPYCRDMRRGEGEDALAAIPSLRSSRLVSQYFSNGSVCVMSLTRRLLRMVRNSRRRAADIRRALTEQDCAGFLHAASSVPVSLG